MTEPYDRVEHSTSSEEPRTKAEHTNTRVEEFTVSGDKLLEQVKALWRRGNIRRIIVKNADGKVLFEIPLAVGIVGGLVGVTVLPFFTAIAAIGALVARLTLVIEKTTD